VDVVDLRADLTPWDRSELDDSSTPICSSIRLK